MRWMLKVRRGTRAGGAPQADQASQGGEETTGSLGLLESPVLRVIATPGFLVTEASQDLKDLRAFQGLRVPRGQVYPGPWDSEGTLEIQDLRDPKACQGPRGLKVTPCPAYPATLVLQERRARPDLKAAEGFQVLQVIEVSLVLMD